MDEIGQVQQANVVARVVFHELTPKAALTLFLNLIYGRQRTADLLDLDENTVKKRAQRAKKELKKHHPNHSVESLLIVRLLTQLLKVTELSKKED